MELDGKNRTNTTSHSTDLVGETDRGEITRGKRSARTAAGKPKQGQEKPRGALNVQNSWTSWPVSKGTVGEVD